MNIYGICFFQLDADAPRLFGFPEFLAGLALMALVWSIVDVRYRFRISSAPLPLEKLTFGVISSIGILTILTDLWRSEEWFVPCGSLLTPNSWQALLAMTLLIAFLLWAWFAFIKPPVFSPLNARRYAQALYRGVVKSAPTELAVIAEELGRSAGALVSNATSNVPSERAKRNVIMRWLYRRSDCAAYADDILLLIADNRVCKAIVSDSPQTALLFFLEITGQGKYGINIGAFARNVVGQALLNKDSFIYHEVNEYETGLIGGMRPITHTIFSDRKIVEQTNTLFDQNYKAVWSWDSEQWEAYCRALLVSFEASMECGVWNTHPYIFRAIDRVVNSLSTFHRLNGIVGSWDKDESKRLSVVMAFLRQCVEVVNGIPVPEGITLRLPDKNPYPYKTIYDFLAEALFEVIFYVSSVRTPWWECWNYQHNMVWSKIFHLDGGDGKAERIVRLKLRRLIYDEIIRLETFPNYKGAKILAFCLNVTGLESRGRSRLSREAWPLLKAVRAWVKKNYMSLHAHNPNMTTGLLPEKVFLDVERKRVVREFPERGLRVKSHYTYIQLK